jgi:CheY-like chemotaxis protein
VNARRARILVVDDEPLVASALRRTLAREHDLTLVDSGAEALKVVSGGARFDVILCDLMMPGLSGMDLHAQMTALAPEQAARMVFMTGGAFTVEARAFLAHVPNERVEKPFDVEELRAVVRRVAATP